MNHFQPFSRVTNCLDLFSAVKKVRRAAAHRAAMQHMAWMGMDALEPRTMMDATPAGIIVYNAPGAGGSYDIYTMNVDGSNNKDITNNTATDAYPQVSEDGTLVAFASDRAAPGTGKLDVYIMNIDGSNVRRITNDGASWDPAFNYDKSKVLFTSTGADGLYDIFVANSDGTNRVNVTNSPGADEFASWNDDGTKIVFGSYRAANGTNNEEIYEMNADGSNQTRLTFNAARDTYPAVAADGRIAFTTERDGNREIYIMNADGSNPVDITNDPSTDQVPYWEPDGGRLSYTSYRDGNGEVYIMNSDGSNNHRITFNTVQDVYAGWGETPPATPPLPVITIADASITEGNSGTKVLNFTATLSASSTQTVSAAFATADGTAISTGTAADFVAASGIVTFAPGAVTQYISVTIKGDVTFESDETFAVNLTNPANATIGDSQAVGTITNDDAVSVPGTLKLSASTYSINEAGPTVTLTVTRTGGSGGAVGVSYSTSNGTAIAGSDFTTTAGVLSWASGDTSSRTIVVPITNDAIYEGNENFYVILSGTTGGATLGSPASALVTIVDNDPAPVPGKLQLSAPTYSVNEAGPTVTLTVTRAGGTAAVGVSYGTSDGTALAGSDFTATSGVLAWAVGDTSSRTIVIPISNDALYEGNENFHLTLSNPTGGATLGTPSSALVTIVDDDPAPVNQGVIVYMGYGTSTKPDIFTMNADGSNAINLTNDSSYDVTSQVSDDGSMIAFASDRAQSGSLDIYTMKIDGSNVRRITTDGSSYEPALSPDNTKIAFTSWRSGNYEIWVANADGTNPVNIANNASVDSFPTWTPDGRIVFTSYRGDNGTNEDVYAMNADGSNLVRLTSTTGRDTFPDVSPDGSKITFTSERTGNRDIFVMNADGTNQVDVTNNPAGDQSSSFSPDGTKLVYQTTRDGNSEVYTMNVNGTANQRLTSTAANEAYATWAAKPVLNMNSLSISKRLAAPTSAITSTNNILNESQTRMKRRLVIGAGSARNIISALGQSTDTVWRLISAF